MISNCYEEVNTGVDSHLDKLGTSRGAGCLRRAYRGIYRGRPSVFFALFLLMLIAGAAAAPGHAQAASCAGTGACYWVGGTIN